MTVPSTIRRAGPFATNGAQVDFAFDFKVFNEEDLTVTSSDEGVDAVLELATDYTVELNEDQDSDPGGTVTLLAAPDGPTITLTSDTSIEQQVVITNQGGFYPRVFNDVFDRLTIYVQELSEKVGRAVLRTLGTPVAGLYVVTDAEGGFTYSVGTGADGALRADLAASTGLTLVGGLAARLPLSVFDYSPSDAVTAAVVAGTHNTDITPWVNTAMAAAVAAGRPLWFPSGTFPLVQLEPIANLEVWTNGRSTIFQQLDTEGVSKQVIRVTETGVRLWPGGAATIKGGMTAGGVNATSFNHAIMVYPQSGQAVDIFVCGDVYGEDLGGDVVCTATGGTGTIGHCQIGFLYGDNVYRNVLSVTAGTSGTVAGVDGKNVGLLTWDFEPDPVSGSPCQQWHIGFTRGNRVSAVGDPAVPMGAITYDTIEADYDLGSSTPVFNYGGVSEAGTPNLFRTGFRYRNTKSIVGNTLIVRNHALAAIADIGEGGGDTICEKFKADYCEVHGCGETSTYEVAQQKTRVMEFGCYVSTDKPAGNPSSFLGGALSDSWLKVGSGHIDGRVVLQHTGNVALGEVAIAGLAGNFAFYTISGEIRLTGTECSGSQFIFQNCTKIPLCIGCNLDVTGGGGEAIATGGSANAQYVRCTVRGADINLGWFNASTALSNAADDAAAAALGTPVALGEMYRNGSVLMVRIA